MNVRLVSGDLLDSKRQTLVNTVNCVGVMGKGIALKFKRRYPDMYEDYVHRCYAGAVLPGVPYVFDVGDGRLICNFPTKKHWRGGSKLEWIEQGLVQLVADAPKWGVQDLAVPPLGCGHGGLSWDDVGPMMLRHLSQLHVPADIYVPAGVATDPPAQEQLRLL